MSNPTESLIPKEQPMSIADAQAILQQVMFAQDASELQGSKIASEKMFQAFEVYGFHVITSHSHGYEFNQFYTKKKQEKDEGTIHILLRLSYTYTPETKNREDVLQNKLPADNLYLNVDQDGPQGGDILHASISLIRPTQPNVPYRRVKGKAIWGFGFMDKESGLYAEGTSMTPEMSTEEIAKKQQILWKGIQVLAANLLTWDNPGYVSAKDLLGKQVPEGKIIDTDPTDQTI